MRIIKGLNFSVFYLLMAILGDLLTLTYSKILGVLNASVNILFFLNYSFIVLLPYILISSDLFNNCCDYTGFLLLLISTF